MPTGGDLSFVVLPTCGANSAGARMPGRFGGWWLNASVAEQATYRSRCVRCHLLRSIGHGSAFWRPDYPDRLRVGTRIYTRCNSIPASDGEVAGGSWRSCLFC